MSPADPTVTRLPALPAEAETLAPAPTSPGPLPLLPGYEIEQELGRGAMGVVYRARQVKANRPVAVKMILSGAYAGDADRRRFQAEAEAIAQLDHPNVVRVFDVGEAFGTPYFALELCTGGTLAGKLDGTPWPARPAAETVAALADGVAAAHAQGIVHRDLKPANVLLTADGTPKVTDFGLAKSTTGASGLTATGAIMGTPSYMAPEQAAGDGKAVGPRADVYSLGAILYELLTGRPPFRGPTMVDTVLQVLEREPVPPRSLNAQAPKDLETICLKCLQKDPARRCDSAADLAADLRRWLGGLPIRARPVGRWERGWKWVKRNPAVAALLSVLVVLTAAGFTAVSLALIEARNQQATAQKRGDELAAAEAAALGLAEVSARDGYFSSIGLAQRLWQAGDVEAARRELARCPERFRDWEWKHLDRLCRTTGTATPIRGLPFRLAYTPDGKHLICGIAARELIVLRLADGEEVLHLPIVRGDHPVFALAPDGSRLAWVAEGPGGGITKIVKVVTLPDGKPAKEYPIPPGQGVSDGDSALHFGPDDRIILGRFLLSDDEMSVETRDLAAGKRLATGRAFSVPRGIIAGIEVVRFSPDGKRLAAIARDHGIRTRADNEPVDFGSRLGVWEVETAKLVCDFAVQTDQYPGVAFSPNSRDLAWGDGTRVAEVDLSRPGPPQPRFFSSHTEPIHDVAYSPDGRFLASGGDDRIVRVWDRTAAREAYALRGATDSISRVTFGPGGREVAAAEGGLFGGGAREIWRWPATDPAADTVYGPTTQRVSACLELAPQPGRYLALDLSVGGNDGYGINLHGPAGPRPLDVKPTGRPIFQASFSADGRRVAFALDGVRILDPDTAAEVARFDVPKDSEFIAPLDRVALSTDGRRAAHVRTLTAKTKDGKVSTIRLKVRVWDVASQTAIDEFEESLDPPVPTLRAFAWATGLEFDRSGDRLAMSAAVIALDQDETALMAIRTVVLVHDLAGKKTVCRAAPKFAPRCLAFDPTGNVAVAGGLGGDAGFALFDVKTGRELLSRRGLALPILAIAFSPDCKRLATAGADRLVKLWSWGDGEARELLTLHGHTRPITTMTFSPDGRYLMTGTGIDVPMMVTIGPGIELRRPMEIKTWDAGTRGREAGDAGGRDSAEPPAGYALKDPASGRDDLCRV